MAVNSKDDEALALLWAAHLAELRSMSDADILEGVDLPKLRTDRAVLMASVKAEAGRRRMAAAKVELERKESGLGAVRPAVSMAEARAFLERASNDSRFTIAARALDDMTDEMVMRNYARLQQLMGEDSPKGSV